MTPDIVIRMEATQATVKAFNLKKLDWQNVDCVRLGLEHLTNMGYVDQVRELKSKLGTWGNERQALRAMLRMKPGDEGLPGLVDRWNFERLQAPTFALTGDLVAFPAESPWLGTIGVATGMGQAISFAHDHCLVGQLAPAIIAWRVPALRSH